MVGAAKFISDNKEDKKSFRVNGWAPDPVPVENGVRQVFDLAIDAVDWRSRPEKVGPHPQYRNAAIQRNMLKVFAGVNVRELDGTAVPNRFLTGKWGAGVFEGDSLLAALVQWVAASAAGMEEMVSFFFSRGTVVVSAASSPLHPLIPISIPFSLAFWLVLL